MHDAKSVLQELTKRTIAFENVEHPPVFTCEESQKLCPPMPGKKNKNLFLRNRKGDQYYLVTLPQDRRVDLKHLSQILGVSGLSFASERRLQEVLGVAPGSVGLLALLNDDKHQTKVYIDQELLEDSFLQSHPLINTETTAVDTKGFLTFLREREVEVKSLKIAPESNP